MFRASRIPLAVLVAVALAAPAPAFAAKNYNSSRSNVSKKPGLAAPIAGVTVAVAPQNRGPSGHVDRGATSGAGTIVFKAVPPGDYQVSISPRRQGRLLLDGLTVQGALVMCDAEAQKAAETLVCSIRVLGRKPQDVALGLLAIDPSTPEPEAPPAR